MIVEFLTFLFICIFFVVISVYKIRRTEKNARNKEIMFGQRRLAELKVKKGGLISDPTRKVGDDKYVTIPARGKKSSGGSSSPSVFDIFK